MGCDLSICHDFRSQGPTSKDAVRPTVKDLHAKSRVEDASVEAEVMAQPKHSLAWLQLSRLAV